jgi:hypothetical protein
MKSVFVVSSRKWYPEVKQIKNQLDEKGVKGYYPYFEIHDQVAEIDENMKKKLTLGHFPEIEEIDTLYVYAEDGYVGYSVTIEITYAFAHRKEIITSEPVKEFAVRALVNHVMTPDKFIAYITS